LIDEDHVRRATRERFDAHGTRSRAEIKKSRLFNSRREDIEERLTQTI
jgi:hypothetical protein